MPDLLGGERGVQRDGHHQQAGKADLAAFLAVNGEHRKCEALPDDDKPDQDRVRGGEACRDDGQRAQQGAAQHLRAAVFVGAGLIDQRHAEGAEGRNQAFSVEPEDASENHDREQDAGGAPHAAIEVLAVDEAFEAGDADVHGPA